MRAGELLQEAAAVDPRIAESMEMTRQQPRDGLDAATFIERPEDLPQRLSELTSHAMEPVPPKLAVVVDRVDADGDLARRAELDRNLDGYSHTVDTYAIRHALMQHGDPAREAARGNVALTPADIAAIPDVLRSPDRIEPVMQTNKRGHDLIRYVKSIGDTVYYVEEVRTGRRELAMQTMYKKPAGSGGDLRPDAGAGSGASPGLSSAADRSRSTNNVAPIAETGKAPDTPGNPKIVLPDVSLGETGGRPDAGARRSVFIMAGKRVAIRRRADRGPAAGHHRRSPDGRARAEPALTPSQAGRQGCRDVRRAVAQPRDRGPREAAAH